MYNFIYLETLLEVELGPRLNQLKEKENSILSKEVPIILFFMQISNIFLLSIQNFVVGRLEPRPALVVYKFCRMVSLVVNTV